MKNWLSICSCCLLVVTVNICAAILLHAGPGSTPEDDPGGEDIRRLISQLDADVFAARDEAMRTLAARGAATVPYLVESLSNPSAELRTRIMLLLTQQESFELVALHLLTAIDRPGGVFARTVLQQRCLQQIDAAAEKPNCERLFKFWGTNCEKYRHESLLAFQNAKTSAELARVVEPLLHVREKAGQFENLVTRLTELSIASDNGRSPGYTVAETYARGLCDRRANCVAFGAAYVDSLEKLAIKLEETNHAPHAIRQEVAERASWSQGATSFLVQLLDPESQPSKTLAQTIHIAPQFLQESFFQGLSSPDAHTYARGVGRVHTWTS